jgi:hypothetical protein
MTEDKKENKIKVYDVVRVGIVGVVCYGIYYAWANNSIMLASMSILGGIGAMLITTALVNEAIADR